MEKRCILDEERLCVDCGECLMCDLDPNKHCDNCMRCVKKTNADYLAIEIDEVFSGTEPDVEETPPARLAESEKESRPRAVRAKSRRRAMPGDSGKTR